MKKTGYPFDAFGEWLQEYKGISPVTAVGYGSQCRRIIRSAGVSDVCSLKLLACIEADQVELFIIKQTSKSQTPFRRSWTCFYEFMTTEGHKLTKIDLCRGWENVPTDVATAIREMDRQDFPFRLISSMKWNVDPKMTKVFGSNVIDVDGRKVVLPTDPLITITQWAYGDKMPSPKDWLIPRAPKSKIPMPLTMLRKVAGII